MDFTDLKERAREAKLDYGEAESLVRYLNFQRERVGEAPIHENYGHRFCQRLSENYSGVKFEVTVQLGYPLSKASWVALLGLFSLFLKGSFSQSLKLGRIEPALYLVSTQQLTKIVGIAVYLRRRL